MLSKSLVTVIVPVFNRTIFLPKATENVLN